VAALPDFSFCRHGSPALRNTLWQISIFSPKTQSSNLLFKHHLQNWNSTLAHFLQKLVFSDKEKLFCISVYKNEKKYADIMVLPIMTRNALVLSPLISYALDLFDNTFKSSKVIRNLRNNNESTFRVATTNSIRSRVVRHEAAYPFIHVHF